MITTEVRRLTPADAKELLASNHVNRKSREQAVLVFRRDMESGSWRMTGEAIKISRSGALLDGQHRLMALAGAKVEYIEFLVVSGLEDDVQKVMDSGSARSAQDALKFEFGNIAYLTITGALARWIAAGVMPGENFSTARSRRVSNTEVVEAFRNNRDVERAAQAGKHFINVAGGSLSASAVGYVWLLLSRIDVEATHEFFAAMESLNFSSLDDPRKAALRRLMAIGEEKTDTSGDKTTAIVSVLTRAWNYWVSGTGVEVLPIRHQGRLIAPVQPLSPSEFWREQERAAEERERG